MSHVLIQEYLNNLQDLRKVSGTEREGVVSEAFKDLLKGWGRSHDLVFVPQYEITTPARERRYVDGALLHELRVPFGYWEAKDEKDDLDAEIAHKLRRGYPQDNIIFEDSTQAVLIQLRQEVMRCAVDDVPALEKLLNLFFAYEAPEVADFRQAVEQFKVDLPAVLHALREMIERALAQNAGFRKAAERFLHHARETINPSLNEADVREMLIQHILTEEIFSKVFGEDDFHRQNNIAKELYALEGTFFVGEVKKKMLKGLGPYYAAIRAAADWISNHHEKQTFLKVIYEGFYRVYNPKAADRLGVIYTPNEIVRFMVESAAWLCERHFGRDLIDKDVEILDPAAGTGTFICELLEHFRGQPDKLKHKYLEELHANEVAILPYYVANLNIEATYAAITGEYAEWPNLCFVDTLDNVAGLRTHHGEEGELFGLSEENVARIKRQNRRKISVIIGNPPYNANQLNENENNKNRTYPEIDRRIKSTYIAASTAQKTKLYDMYARFFRWASDRLGENGILAFVTNRSFVDSRTFDGFRHVVADEFCEIHVVDLGGDVRANPKLSGTKHNVFGIQTGVAISFLVRRAKTTGCRIFYARRPELETADEKLAFLASAALSTIEFEEIRPNSKHDWIDLVHNDFDSLVPIASKQTKAARRRSEERAVFKLFSMGAITARDEWVYDFDPKAVEAKVRYLIRAYNRDRERLAGSLRDPTLADKLDYSIKWTRAVKRDLAKGRRYSYDPHLVVESLYRPFVRKWLYFGKNLIEMPNQMPAFFKAAQENVIIFFNDRGSRSPFSPLATTCVAEYHLAASTDGFQAIGLFRFLESGTRLDNITDWALAQFRKHYQRVRGRKGQPISKEEIFYYVYGVLHDPIYREKYALNLKRELPRIPFYKNFWQWAEWGRELIDLHIGYGSVKPFPLKRVDAPDEEARKAGVVPKALLKADKAHGSIALDTETTLTGIPRDAWDYHLGNRSALEWVLDQYKEKKPKDPTIREKFNTYRFSDYKENVIDLVARVTTVSVRTVAVVRAMKNLKR